MGCWPMCFASRMGIRAGHCRQGAWSTSATIRCGRRSISLPSYCGDAYGGFTFAVRYACLRGWLRLSVFSLTKPPGRGGRASSATAGVRSSTSSVPGSCCSLPSACRWWKRRGGPPPAARRSGAGSSTLPRKASRAYCMTRPARQGTAVGAHRRRGIGPDLLRATGRGHALGRSRRSRIGRHLAAVRATHLGGPPPTTTPRAHLQALERCRLRRKGRGHRRPLHGPATSRGRALHRREVPDPGAGAHMTRPAARLRAPHRPDPRLHPPRHHHTACRARRPGRNRARPLHAAPSQR